MNLGIDLSREGGGWHAMRMAAVEKNAEGCIFESALIHRGKGAPIPLDRERGSKLTGFTMWSDGSSEAKRVTIQSAALHYYGGTNAWRIPLSDKCMYASDVEPPSYGRVVYSSVCRFTSRACGRV
jgi:hypothetical protein